MAEVKAAASDPIPDWMPLIKPGRYADGKPFDRIRYIQCKVSLQPDVLTSREALFAVGELVKRPAKDNGITFREGSFRRRPHGIREVQFLDTADFRLYNNSFILRRRVRYHDGFPEGDPEIVFKFRHPDPQLAAETAPPGPPPCLLRATAAGGQGLDAGRGHQDPDRLPPQGQSAQCPRIAEYAQQLWLSSTS